MNFKILRLEIENFRSIQSKVTLNLKSGLFSIEGINYTETNSTNGCGKSTLISALFWCLTGNSLTNEALADDVINLKVGKNCKVVVYLQADKDEIKITRVRKDSEYNNNLFLEINGQDLSCHKVADTQDRINKLIKIPFDLLRSTIIMTSGMESAFSSMTPQQRIQTLESIRDYSIWEKIRDEANKDIKAYNEEINTNLAQINKLDGSVSVYTKMLSTTEEKYNQLVSSFNKDLIIQSINNMNLELDKITTQIAEKELEINNFNKVSFDDKEIKSQMDKLVNDSNELKLQIQVEKNKIDNEIQQLKFSEANLIREISVLDKWFTNDTCPTCGRKLDRTEEEIVNKNKELLDLNNNLSLIKNQIIDKNAQLSNNTNADNINNILNENRNKYNKLQQILDDEKAKEINKNQEYQNLLNTLTSLKNLENNNKLEIQKANAVIDSHDSQLQELNNSITEYKTEIDRLITNKVEFETKNEELGIKKTLSDFYYKLLGTKGELRPYLLSKDIAYLNNRMQFYIGRFFKNTEVSLLLNNASIDIKIQADGIVKNMSSLSGGEKKRVDISIQLALYDLIQTVSQSRFNLLCLDEIESQLDPIGCEQLIEIIEDKAENIETVWWITNHPSVKENISSKILVKKILGKTEVEEK